MENQLVVINPAEFGLEKTEAQKIEAVFTPMLEKMVELEKEYNEVIKLPIDEEATKKARELRLKFVKVRSGTKEIHEKAKAYYLAGGRFVDAWKNAQLFSAQGKESELEKIEKHFELIEQAKKDKINTERELELSKYVTDISMYNYKEMSDEVFTNLLLSVKKSWEVEQLAIKQAEEERIAKEKAEKEEQERIRIENEKLKKEAEAREKELEKERAEQKKKLEAEQLKAKKEAEAREKIEAELKAKKDEEERLKKENEARAQKERLEKLEEEKRAELAPDKDKLKKYAVELGCLEVPQLQSKEAKDILKQALNLLNQAIIILKTN